MLRANSYLLALALMTFPAWTQAQPARLDIDVEQGVVSVSGHGSALTDSELGAIRTRVQTRLERSPLREHGALHISLRGEPLSELTTRLHAIDANDTVAVDAVIDRFVKMRADANEKRPLTEPVEVVIGRQFEYGPANMPGSIVSIGASGTIDGRIDDVVAIGSHVQLGQQAEVAQRFVSVGSDVELAQGARVTGQEVNVSLPAFETLRRELMNPAPTAPSVFARLGWAVFGVLLSFGLGLLFQRVAPELTGQTLARLQERPWPSFGIGLAHYFAIIPVAVLLVLTVVGIVLLPLYFMLLALVLWLGYIAAASYLGGLLAKAWQPWQRLLLGLLVLAAVAWLPVVGGLVGFGAVTSGFGAIMLTLYRARKRPGRPQPTAPSAPPSEALPATGATATQHG